MYRYCSVLQCSVVRKVGDGLWSRCFSTKMSANNGEASQYEIERITIILALGVTEYIGFTIFLITNSEV